MTPLLNSGTIESKKEVAGSNIASLTNAECQGHEPSEPRSLCFLATRFSQQGLVHFKVMALLG
jgi:hypothetical protein